MPTINRGRNRRRRQDVELGDVARKERQKIYQSQTWQDMRRGHLMAHPLCEVCEALGRTTLAIDVHHLQTFMTDEGVRRDIAYNPANLVSLCKQCHQSVHHGVLRGTTTLPELLFRARNNLYEGNK